MDKQFKPTALLVVEHNITGMKYFCKTTMLDRVHRYKGSGIYWTKHLREHGFDVKVGMLGFYVEKQRCLDAAKKFSEENNIVESKEWANSIIETGMNGAILNGERNPFYGRHHTQETKEKLRMKNTGRHFNKGANRSPEHRAKLAEATKAQWARKRASQIQLPAEENQ